MDKYQIQQIEYVQAHLAGVWTNKLDGCPHYHPREDIGRCDQDEMRPCIYETNPDPFCDVLQEIIEEWRIEYEICDECLQVRPDDERVKAGMKCAVCAGEWIPAAMAQIEGRRR